MVTWKPIRIFARTPYRADTRGVTLDEVRSPEALLLDVVTGSRAYGTDTPESDTDLRGVFIMPRRLLYGLDTVEQVSDRTNDETYYEVGRFIELLSKSNPNILELLFVEQDCVRHRDPILDLITPELVLSRQCEHTFAGYAMAQIGKARGLNKKIVNPMDGPRKSMLEFCYAVSGQGAIPIERWLAEKGLRQEYCGLVKINHMRDAYGLYYSESAELAYRGIVRDAATTTDVNLSPIPKGEEPIGWMTFNKDGFKKYCKEYREYHTWLKERNEARYANNIEHGKNYDSKNMMHTYRLLDMAEEIATEGRLLVRRPNRDFLMHIRRGEMEYEEIIALAEEKVAAIQAAFASSDLPERPDRARLQEVLVEIREARYGGVRGEKVHKI